jgi:hypothetical protein
MKTTIKFVGVSAIVFMISAFPAFAQKGNGGVLGVGVGLGGQTNVQAGGANVGLNTNTDVIAQTPAQVDALSHIQSNSPVAARVESMLPAGMSMDSAAAGFKNEGQFLSALHTSHNLGIPFDQLKAKMTGSGSMSLGSAIQASKPEMKKDQAAQEAKKAEAQAKATASGKAAVEAKK